MSLPAAGADPAPLADAASLALRIAQRTFAALLDALDAGELGDARLRACALRTLSALSADDRGRFVEWIALLISTHGAARRDRSMARLGRVDRDVLAHVGRALRARVGLIVAGVALAPSPAQRAR